MEDIKTLLNKKISDRQIQLPKILSLEKLGSGESNENYLALLANKVKVVIRIAKLYGKESLGAEYEFLKILPSNVAPEPIFLNLSGDILKQPFMIQSFIKGNKVEKWTDELLINFGKTLATIHKIKRSKVDNSFSINKYFERINSHFFEDISHSQSSKNIRDLFSKTNNYISDNNFLFNNISFNSLIHGDLNTNNIILQDNQFKIIDWELAEYHDNARDFATFFYSDIKYFNWRIQLNKSQQDVLFESYIAVFGMDENLIKRVEFWENIDKVASIIYCSWKYIKTKEKRFLDMSEQLHSTLPF